MSEVDIVHAEGVPGESFEGRADVALQEACFALIEQFRPATRGDWSFDHLGVAGAIRDREIPALEEMLSQGRFQQHRSVGIEFEGFLADRDFNPFAVAPDVLRRLAVMGNRAQTQGLSFEKELGLIDIEGNPPPVVLDGNPRAFLDLETTYVIHSDVLRRVAEHFKAKVVLAGTLPTLGVEHLTDEILDGGRRLDCVARGLAEDRDGKFQISIEGQDGRIEHTLSSFVGGVAMSAFQFSAAGPIEEYVATHNAQIALLPLVIAANANSPTFLKQRAGHDQRNLLAGMVSDPRRNGLTVGGNRELGVPAMGEYLTPDDPFRDFRALTFQSPYHVSTFPEDSLAIARAGDVPTFPHISSQGRTNYPNIRPRLGVTDEEGGVMNIHDENRVMSSAGPVDSMAGAFHAYYLARYVAQHTRDLAQRMPIEDVRANIRAVGVHGLDATIRFMGRSRRAGDVVRESIPLARAQARAEGVDEDVIERYLGTDSKQGAMNSRIDSGQTASVWFHRALGTLGFRSDEPDADRTAKLAEVTAVYHDLTSQNRPVGTWPRFSSN